MTFKSVVIDDPDAGRRNGLPTRADEASRA
jgi:hypothetical protein